MIYLEWSDFLKTTGIIRRIDDLGRLVIPKELRRSLRIKTGESLEIFVDQEDIILKKYSPMESIEEAAAKYVDSFNKVINHSVIVTDKDKVIAASGLLKKKYLGKTISEFTDRSIERRDSFVERQKKTFLLSMVLKILDIILLVRFYIIVILLEVLLLFLQNHQLLKVKKNLRLFCLNYYLISLCVSKTIFNCFSFCILDKDYLGCYNIVNFWKKGYLWIDFLKKLVLVSFLMM